MCECAHAIPCGAQRVEKPLSATDEDEEPIHKETWGSVVGSACCMPPVLPLALSLVLLAARLQGASLSLAVPPPVPAWSRRGGASCLHARNSLLALARQARHASSPCIMHRDASCIVMLHASCIMRLACDACDACDA